GHPEDQGIVEVRAHHEPELHLRRRRLGWSEPLRPERREGQHRHLDLASGPGQPLTTIVLVRKGDSAVIAADSLTTFGTTRLAPAYDRSPEKIVAYRDSFIGVAGSAAHQLVLENVLRRNPSLELHGKAAIYESFRKLHPILKEEAFLNPKEEEDDPYESSQMTAMIANSSGIFAVYSMREVFEFDRFW